MAALPGPYTIRVPSAEIATSGCSPISMNPGGSVPIVKRAGGRAGGSGCALQTATPATTPATTAVTIMAATHGSVRRQPAACDALGAAAMASGAGVVNASLISILASPICCSRSFRSFTRHRRMSRLIATGVLAGSRLTSGSRSSTCASVSSTVGPAKSRCPVSIS